MRHAWIVLLVFCGAPLEANAQNGLEFLSQGAKGAGRGGASTAMADDSLSVTRNPALLTQLRGTRVDGTLLLRSERIRRRNLTDDVLDENVGIWPVPMLGFSTGLGSADVDTSDENGPYLGFGLFQPMTGVLAPTATLAFELSDTVSFGVSVNVLLSAMRLKSGGGGKGGGPSPIREFRPAGKVSLHYQPDGTPIVPSQPFDPGTGKQLTWANVFDVGFQAVSTSGASPASSSLSSGGEKVEIDYELENLFGAGVAAQFGFLWTPRDDLSLAFSVRTPGIIFSPSGSGSIDLTQAVDVVSRNQAVGLLIGSLIDSTLPNRGQNGFAGEYEIELDDVIIPASISLGAAWWPLPRWVLTLDLRWIGWSHSMDQIEVRASGGNNADLNEIAGRTVKYTLPLDWRDQFVLAVGTTFAVNDWLLLRAGYNHGENPIPSSSLFSSSAVIEDHLTCGVGLRFGSWDIDVAYAWGLPKRVDMPGASFKVELHQLFLGVGYEF